MKLKNEIGNEKLNEELKDKIAETSESKKTKIEGNKIKVVRGLILTVHCLKKRLRKRRQRKQKGAGH